MARGVSRIARKPQRDILQSLGYGSRSSGTSVDDIDRTIENLRLRLESQGIRTDKPKDEVSLLTKTLRTLNLPGTAVRSTLREVLDREPGFNVKRAYNRDSLWNKQVGTTDILDAMGIAPENKFARGAVGFAGDVLTDPLTFLSGGIASGLKAGLPFSKATTQLTSKGLGQVARVVPYLDDGKLTAKTIPDAFTRLFKGKEITSPAAGVDDLVAKARQEYKLTDDQAMELTKRLQGEAVKTARPKSQSAVNVLQVGARVRPTDRRNLGTVLSIDENTGTASVQFINRKDGAQAIKSFRVDDLRDSYGNRMTLDPSGVKPYQSKAMAGKSLVDQLFPRLKKELRPEQTVMEPGPLAGIGDAVGKMFSTTYGRNPELMKSFQSLKTASGNQVEQLRRQIVEISKKYNLTPDQQKDLFRIAEEPEYRRALGIVEDYTPSSEIAGLDPAVQQAVMKALPRFTGGADPNLVQAANELQDITRHVATLSEAELGWLNENNLLEDYIRHFRETKAPSFADFLRGKKTISVQDDSLLYRENRKPVSELNPERQAAGKPLFVDNALEATYLRNAKAIQATNAFKWVRDHIGRPDLGRKLDDYVAEATKGLSPEEAARQAKALQDLSVGSRVGEMRVWEGGGKLRDLGKHLVSEDMFEVLTTIDKHYINGTDEGIKSFLQAFDWATNKWRPLVTLANPAWLVNNGIGNLWNMYLGGVSATDFPMRLRQGWDALNGKEGAFKTAAGTVRLDEALALAMEKGGVGHTRIWADPGLAGMRDELSKAIGSDQKANIVKRGLTKYLDFMGDTAMRVEDSNKLSLFIDYLSKTDVNPQIYEQMGRDAALAEMAERAALHVKKYLFDYGDLTQFDRQIMRRVLPFWSWTKFNLPTQIRALVETPEKFARLGQVKRGVEGFSEGEEETDRPAWLAEAMRLPSIGDTPLYYNPRLPAQDISRVPFIGPGDTGREFFGGMNPLLKLPLELTFNKSLFTGREIERYPGETVEVIGGQRIPARTAYTANSTLGVVGKGGAALQAFAPDSTATDVLRVVRTVVPGLYSYDPEKQRVSNAYAEAQRLRDMQRKYQDESGERLPTLEALGMARGRR